MLKHIQSILSTHQSKANDAATWNIVKSEVSEYLNTLWKQGAIIGKTSSDAFSVEIGLGSTMTAEDMLDGSLRLVVKVALQRPGEFTEFTFQQQQQIR